MLFTAQKDAPMTMPGMNPLQTAESLSARQAVFRFERWEVVMG
jgi:hypothetical protein